MSLSRTFSNFLNKVLGNLPSITVTPSGSSWTISVSKHLLDFRNTSASSGIPFKNINVPALSLTVPAGATLGTTNAVSGRLILLIAYNSGNPVLCITNLSGGMRFDETNFISPTVISSGSTLAGTVYSNSTVSSNSPYRVVGILDSTQVTAGQWISSPTLVQPLGGTTGSSLGGFGYGQTWQAFTSPTRDLSVAYSNMTGRPIQDNIVCTNPTSTYITASVDGVNVGRSSGTSTGGFNTNSISFIVPPGSSYTTSSSGSNPNIISWAELR